MTGKLRRKSVGIPQNSPCEKLLARTFTDDPDIRVADVTEGRIWETPHEADTGSGVYTNERNTAWQYDADGRLTSSSETTYTYDAAGRAVGVVSPETDVVLRQTQVFDGNGVRTKLLSQQEVYHEQTDTTSTDTKTQYFVTSSVLNSVMTELDQSGQKMRTFVYQGAEILAWQQQSGTTQTIAWEHRDPSQASVRGSTMAAELEPLGSNAGVFKGFVIPPPRSPATLEAERTYPFFGVDAGSQCSNFGIPAPCSQVHILDYIYSNASDFGGGISGSRNGLNSMTIDRKIAPPGPAPIPIDLAPDFVEWLARRGIWWIPLGDHRNPGDLLDLDREYMRGLKPQDTPLSPGELSKLEKEIKDTYNKPACKKFVDAVLTKVTGNPNPPKIMDLFNTIKGQRGFVFGKTTWGTAEAEGNIDGGRARIRFMPGDLFVPVPQGPNLDGQAGIHEIMHEVGPGYNDEVLARVTHDVALEQGYDLQGKTGLPRRTDYPDYPYGNKWVIANSSYYSSRIYDACK